MVKQRLSLYRTQNHSESLCDKVYFIQEGKISSNGDLEEAFELMNLKEVIQWKN